jgi:hypothetical protein
MWQVRLSAKSYIAGKTSSIQRKNETTVILPEHLTLKRQTSAAWKHKFEIKFVTFNTFWVSQGIAQQYTRMNKLLLKCLQIKKNNFSGIEFVCLYLTYVKWKQKSC